MTEPTRLKALFRRIAVLSLFAIGWTLSAPQDPTENPSPPGLSVRDMGAVGDGTSLDSTAIQKAIDEVASTGGTVVFPPGRYLSGTLFLRSNVSLHLTTGATLLGSRKIEDYTETLPAMRSYTDNYVRHSLIYGEDLRNVTIEGRGTIDGQGAAFRWKEYKDRPYAIRLVNCKDVRIEDISLRNSAMWMQHYLGCENLTIRGIRVFNHSTYNNDGVDIDGCKNVAISDCIIDSDDDALVLKSTFGRACEDVTITNCVLSSHTNALKMGTESNGGFKNISISNCVIKSPEHSESIYGTQRGLAAIALEIVDGGTLDGVTISNIAIRGVGVPIFMRLGDRGRPFVRDGERPGVGSFRNVRINHLVATGASNIGCSITGLPDSRVQEISLSDITLEFDGGGTREFFEREVPENREKYPESAMFGELPAYGFYVRHAEQVKFDNVRVAYGGEEERPALIFDDVEDLSIEDVRARPVAELPLLWFKDVRRAAVRNSVALAGTPVFLGLTGQSDSISVIGNDLSRADAAFRFEEPVTAVDLFETANKLPD